MNPAGCGRDFLVRFCSSGCQVQCQEKEKNKISSRSGNFEKMSGNFEKMPGNYGHLSSVREKLGNFVMTIKFF